jgi:hypothetical protein
MNEKRRVTLLSLLALALGGCANQELKGFSEGGGPSLDDTIDRKLQALRPIDETSMKCAPFARSWSCLPSPATARAA